jgi:hypothetical protein
MEFVIEIATLRTVPGIMEIVSLADAHQAI